MERLGRCLICSYQLRKICGCRKYLQHNHFWLHLTGHFAYAPPWRSLLWGFWCVRFLSQHQTLTMWKRWSSKVEHCCYRGSEGAWLQNSNRDVPEHEKNCWHSPMKDPILIVGPQGFAAQSGTLDRHSDSTSWHLSTVSSASEAEDSGHGGNTSSFLWWMACWGSPNVMHDLCGFAYQQLCTWQESFQINYLEIPNNGSEGAATPCHKQQTF